MTREDLLEEIDEIASSLADDPKSWENITLERYLDAMHRWLDDIGDTFDDLPKWDFVALLLGAAKVYE